MKRIIQIISSIAIVMAIGCNRESSSTRESDAAAHNSKITLARRHYSLTDEHKAARAEWERALKKQERQYERMEELAKEVSTACAGTNGDEAVDALLAKVSDVIDEYVCCVQGHAISERTSLVAPFARAVEACWPQRLFEKGESPPENLLYEIRCFYSLNTKTVDLLRKKVGNSFESLSLEFNICWVLKRFSLRFDRIGWKEQKKYVDRMLENWLETRYDVLEGNPLKDACENVEFYAAKDPNRDKLPAPIYSRTKNMHVDKALWVVGRLPKWFAAWAAEMEKQDNSKSK